MHEEPLQGIDDFRAEPEVDYSDVKLPRKRVGHYQQKYVYAINRRVKSRKADKAQRKARKLHRK